MIQVEENANAISDYGNICKVWKMGDRPSVLKAGQRSAAGLNSMVKDDNLSRKNRHTIHLLYLVEKKDSRN